MRSDMSPTSDLPFEAEVINHIARRLSVLEIPLDREWLSGEPDMLDSLLLHGHGSMLAKARASMPATHAQWELSDLFKYAMPPVVFDLSNSPISTFREFEFLYRRLLGEASRPWLGAIFLAAAACPGLSVEHRTRLISSFDPDMLATD